MEGVRNVQGKHRRRRIPGPTPLSVICQVHPFFIRRPSVRDSRPGEVMSSCRIGLTRPQSVSLTAIHTRGVVEGKSLLLPEHGRFTHSFSSGSSPLVPSRSLPARLPSPTLGGLPFPARHLPRQYSDPRHGHRSSGVGRRRRVGSVLPQLGM